MTTRTPTSSTSSTSSPGPTTDIADPQLAPRGRDRIAWAMRAMPALAAVRRRFTADRPLVHHSH